jgi:hypothetical protein
MRRAFGIALLLALFTGGMGEIVLGLDSLLSGIPGIGFIVCGAWLAGTCAVSLAEEVADACGHPTAMRQGRAEGMPTTGAAISAPTVRPKAVHAPLAHRGPHQRAVPQLQGNGKEISVWLGHAG